MADERALAAVERIEQALARLEHRLAVRARVEADDGARLRASHQLLRQRVEGAIGEIDRLLDGDDGAR